MAVDHKRFDTPEKLLLLAVIERARVDIKRGLALEARDASNFIFRSDQFERYCELLNLDPVWVRASIGCEQIEQKEGSEDDIYEVPEMTDRGIQKQVRALLEARGGATKHEVTKAIPFSDDSVEAALKRMRVAKQIAIAGSRREGGRWVNVYVLAQS